MNIVLFPQNTDTPCQCMHLVQAYQVALTPLRRLGLGFSPSFTVVMCPRNSPAEYPVRFLLGAMVTRHNVLRFYEYAAPVRGLGFVWLWVYLLPTLLTDFVVLVSLAVFTVK
jgi:hypothetical protein